MNDGKLFFKKNNGCLEVFADEIFKKINGVLQTEVLQSMGHYWSE